MHIYTSYLVLTHKGTSSALTKDRAKGNCFYIFNWGLTKALKLYFRSDSALTAQQRFDMFAPNHPGLHANQTGSPTRTQQPTDRRSRTPGPEHMRAPPERSTDDRLAH